MFRLNWKKGKYAEIHDPLQSRKGTDPKHLTFGGNFEMDRLTITTLLVLINYRLVKDPKKIVITLLSDEDTMFEDKNRNIILSIAFANSSDARLYRFSFCIFPSPNLEF